jgi:hypothetical protein
MTMNRQTSPALLRTAIAAALFASLALVGCKKKAETAVTPPTAGEPAATTPAPTETPAPATSTLTVTSVDLGNAIGADNRVSMPMTTFAKGDTIHASVATDGPGGQLTARWTMGSTPVSSQDKTVPAGPQVTEFSVNKPDGWPAGHYKLEVLVDGNVAQSREYDIK